MFDFVRRNLVSGDSLFSGKINETGVWTFDTDATLEALRKSMETEQPVALLGTAFSFVQLLDDLSGRALRFALPEGSRLMETGGYKGRSRSLPRTGTHALITRYPRVPTSQLLFGYGISELRFSSHDL